MIVDEEGKFLSQRREPRMATLTPRICGDHLQVDRPKGDSFHIPLEPPQPGERKEVRLHGAVRLAQESSRLANDWFSEALNQPCRLVESVPHEDPWRNTDPEAELANTYFPDLYPILITCTESLERLFPDGTISMDRFRPNLVLEGSQAFAEDEWESIKIGSAFLKLVKPCARCQVTTVDQETGVQSGPEPLKTLGLKRRWQGKAVFGWNALVSTPGTIESGDRVKIETRHDVNTLIGPK